MKLSLAIGYLLVSLITAIVGVAATALLWDVDGALWLTIPVAFFGAFSLGRAVGYGIEYGWKS